MSTQLVKLEERALSWPEKAMRLEVVDAASHQFAGEMLLGIKDLERENKEHHRDIKKKQREALNETMIAEKRILIPLQTAEGIIKTKIAQYQRVERRKADEERQRLEAIARRQREEEALRAAAEAETEGATEAEVDAILDEPVVATVVTTPPPPKVEGISTSTIYAAEVTDKGALIKSVAAGQQPDKLLDPNMKALNQMARALKEALNIPGVRVVSETVVRAGRR